ncbi:hypothetical protein K2X33_05280 [bacterium]|nr:hypothetical protein [bacterium]
MSRYILFVRLPFAILAGLLVFMGIFARRGWMDWQRMQTHNIEIADRREKALQEFDDMRLLLKGLEGSTLAQEQAVRQHLGYLRKEELVIEIP